MTAPVALGIDAGGSTTRALAIRGGRAVHSRAGGPGNPRSASPATLLASYGEALRNCPPVAAVAACVAGANDPKARSTVAQVLQQLIPGTAVRVLPDYAATLRACPSSVDACVIAGTGSVVCSATDCGHVITGARGWRSGDPGSAAQLGRMLLHYVTGDAPSPPAETAAALSRALGTGWETKLGQLDARPAPAAWLAKAAPVLTADADAGQPWALSLVADQMGELAAAAAEHLARHKVTGGPAVVAMAGGVWTSPAARRIFRGELRNCAGRPVTFRRLTRRPVAAAATLAEEMIAHDA